MSAMLAATKWTVPAGASVIPAAVAKGATRLSDEYIESSMFSWASSRCNVATCPSVRPMPVLSLSTSNCMATIPIKAKASRPIHKRPRINLSKKALLDIPSRA
jgi:hypothetical protein